MKQIIEVLRLKYAAKLSHEKIARACGLSKGAVDNYVSATHALGITWPLPDGVMRPGSRRCCFRPASRRVVWSSPTSSRCIRRSSARA